MSEKLQLPQLSVAERDRRWKLIRQEMSGRNLDCLIIYGHSGRWGTDMANVRYVSQVGHQAQEAILVFPLDREPICNLWGKSTHGDWNLRAQSWVSDLREGMVPSWSGGVVDRIKELGLERGRIGVVGLGGEKLREPEGRIPYLTYSRILEGLPDTRFENFSEVFWELRLVKSAEEIAFHEKAAEIGDLAIKAMIETARPGVREYEVYANMIYTMLKNGSEHPPMLIWQASPTPLHAGWLPTARPLERGDIIVNEISPRYGGYWAHPHQPVAIGEPRKEYQEMFKVCLESFESGMSVLRPGITLGEFEAAFAQPIKEAGYTWIHPLFHGLGLEIAETPWASIPGAYSGTEPSKVIKEGMVFAPEPMVGTLDKKKGIPLGDTVVVTEKGARRLSKRKLEFVVV